MYNLTPLYKLCKVKCSFHENIAQSGSNPDGSWTHNPWFRRTVPCHYSVGLPLAVTPMSCLASLRGFQYTSRDTICSSCPPWIEMFLNFPPVVQIGLLDAFFQVGTGCAIATVPRPEDVVSLLLYLLDIPGHLGHCDNIHACSLYNSRSGWSKMSQLVLSKQSCSFWEALSAKLWQTT